jgi:type IV pilus assembly protein PilY1
MSKFFSAPTILRGLSLSACLVFAGSEALATTALSNTPIFSTTNVPGNLALTLSVEWPTLQRSAHTGTTYAPATTYLGYFDPNKCYLYYHSATDAGTDLSHFYPQSVQTTRQCTGNAWSGNFLNWATTPTIDPFRWAMTGGFRVVDTPTTTILQKARNTGQGGTGISLDKTLGTTGLVQGATPFDTAALLTRVSGLELRMRFAQNAAALAAPAPLTVYTGTQTTIAATQAYEVTMRVRVCDPTVGVEANCRQYGSNWKPEGLVQRYANRIRYSAFGYLNDPSMLRDGGVLRARQKFVGPRQPVPGEPDQENRLREWDPDTGVFIANPEANQLPGTPNDAASTEAALALPPGTIANSGVISYLNKFGQTNLNPYKDFDPVSELYYTALRYFKNQGNVPEYTNMGTANLDTRIRFADGFPVITNWNDIPGRDPILYSCQRNFILGIGDVNTHRDKNLPGATGTVDEPTKPAAVVNDNTVDTVRYTNRAFNIQGLPNPNINNYSGRNNSAGIVGMAFYANTVDIRPEDTPRTIGKQTIQTFWVDVLENPFVANNQFYLAAKYGGFTVPDAFNPLTWAGPLPVEWWSTNGQTVGAQQRPDNYFTAGQPDAMVAGLTQAFERITAALEAFTTSFSTVQPQVSQSGNASYSALYDPNDWSGELIASELSFNSFGEPQLSERWRASSRLASQLAGSGWDTARRVVTFNGTRGVPFRFTATPSASTMTAAQLANLDTPHDDPNLSDRQNFINYVRGDRTHERSSTATSSTRAYRTRTQLLGDIVGSRARPVGPPALPLSDATNPGYGAFKAAYRNRPPMVYVGANDGMMHAFNGTLTGTDSGREIFAYIPSKVIEGVTAPAVDGLAYLGGVISPVTHRYLVNATPNVFDVDLGRTWNGTAVGSTTDWRSILIGGLGKGGRGYYAIDVTDPASITSESLAAGRVLWEFPNPADAEALNIGFTFGDPLVVKTRKYGWTVIFPSGYNTTGAGGAVAGGGYLYLVNPANGRLLERIATGEGSASNDAGLAHINAYINDLTDGYADAVYGGDLLGNLWRFDLTEPTAALPAPVRLARLVHPTDGAQPITTRPLIEISPKDRLRYVVVGTGRLLSSEDISSRRMQSIYAIRDGNSLRPNAAVHLPAGVSFPIERNELVENTNVLTGVTIGTTSPLMGWFIDLGTSETDPPVAWRQVSEGTSFFGTVAFAPTLPTSDACNPSGTSRIYALDLSNGATQLSIGTTLAAYIAGGEGLITDLRFLSVGGRLRLIAGSDRGRLQSVPTGGTADLRLFRKNWRELSIAN